MRDVLCPTSLRVFITSKRSLPQVDKLASHSHEEDTKLSHGISSSSLQRRGMLLLVCHLFSPLFARGPQEKHEHSKTILIIHHMSYPSSVPRKLFSVRSHRIIADLSSSGCFSFLWAHGSSFSEEV